MPKYKYKAKDPQGNFVTDSIEAENQRDVVSAVRKRGLTVVSIDTGKTAPRRIGGRRKRVKFDELAIFARQLSTMVNAGLPLIEGLRTLYEQIENAGFKEVIIDLVIQVEGGKSFTEALMSYPKIFGSFFINMVRAGEASGQLSEILLRVADYLESVASFRRRLRMAMVYPAMISAMALVITLVLLLKVIPVFQDIYLDFDAELPIPTKALIAVSHWLRRWFVAYILGNIGFIVLLKKFKNTEKGRRIFDRISLKLPVMGDLLKKVAIARFSKTLGTLLASGVPILQALDIVKEVSGNSVIEDAIGNAKGLIKEGKSIEEPLRKSGVFPIMVTKMISVGEKSGRIEEMLNKVSDYYEEQVSAMVSGLSSLLEPLLIIMLGIVVGGIVFSMFLPIFKMSTLIGAK